MLPDIERAGAQLFQFTVPGLPEPTLAVALQEVLGVAALSKVTPIPFAPPFVLGLSEWWGGVITVVDMATVLCGNEPSRPEPATDLHYLIAQVVVDAQRDVVAWPILPGAGALAAPTQAPRADVPPYLSPTMIYVAVTLADRSLILLNLEGLAAPARAKERF
jgi:chemotaxis signal transduction protein